MERRIGSYGVPGGPTLVVVAALHGNESAGVEAAQRVLGELQRRQIPAAGRVVALRGNLGALEAGRRFIDADLNRIWGDQGPEPGSREAEEQASLRRALVELKDESERASVLDLHTTSAGGVPFGGMIDSEGNRELASELPIPMITRLDRFIRGTMLDALNLEGFGGVMVEGGQHRASETLDRLTAAIWMCVVASGVVHRELFPGYAAQHAVLARPCAQLPRIVEAFYGHRIEPDDAFRMQPGFENFQLVARGQQLAVDRNGPIVSPEAGRLLMPLYQGECEDGFFLARELTE